MNTAGMIRTTTSIEIGKRTPERTTQLINHIQMTNFNEIIADWETFYLLAGTAAATLIGLLFIAASIHIDIFHRKTSTYLHHFFALTFNCFFYVLLISMMFLIPKLTPLWLGLPLLLLGGLGLMNAIVQKQRARMDPDIAGKFNAPILGLAGLAIIAILVMLQITLSLYGLVLVILLFLISASQNAFALLILTEENSSA
jgi:hypothetical protein